MIDQLSECDKKVLCVIIAKNSRRNPKLYPEFQELTKEELNNSIKKLDKLGLIKLYSKGGLWFPTNSGLELILKKEKEFGDIINLLNRKSISKFKLNFDRKINSIISIAINEKNEGEYIKGVIKALQYFLKGKVSLDTLDSIGARYLPYMEISQKYENILSTISALETCKNPEEVARRCLKELDKVEE